MVASGRGRMPSGMVRVERDEFFAVMLSQEAHPSVIEPYEQGTESIWQKIGQKTIGWSWSPWDGENSEFALAKSLVEKSLAARKETSEGGPRS